MRKGTILIPMLGRKFGRWTVIAKSKRAKLAQTWSCICECGNRRSVRGVELRRGTSKSCGCLNKDINSARLTRHGRVGTPVYAVWLAMLQRCRNRKNAGYKNYGGRGITVCDQWSAFENFYADMGDPPPGLTLERVNNNSGYSKENCCWADRYVQAANSRRNRLLTLQGITRTPWHWSKILGVPGTTLYADIKRGRLEKYEKLAAAL